MRTRRPGLLILLCLTLVIAAGSLGVASQQLITVNFTTVDVADVLQAVGRLTGVSIGITSSVSGTVTVNIDKKPLEDVLDLVTKLVGADWRKISENAYIVGTSTELQDRYPVAPEVTIHPLLYIRAADAVSALKLAFPSLDTQPNSDSNSIVLMGNSRSLLEAEHFLRAIDVPSKNTMSTSIRLKYADVKSAEKILTDTMPDLKVGTEANLGILSITGPTTLVQKALEVVANFDMAPKPRLYEPTYISPDQVISLISTQYPQLDVSREGKFVSILGRPSEVDKALSSLTAVDVKPILPPVTTSETVKLNYVSAQDMATGLKDAFPNVQVATISQQGTDAVILSGPKNDVATVKKLITGIDKPLPQVHIEAEISEVSPKSFNELGVKWQYEQLGVHELPVTAGGGGSTVEWAPGMKFGKFVHSSVGATGTLGALISSGKATLLANPSLVAQHGVESHIHIGEKIPYEVTQVVQGALVRSVETEDIGIKLDITPLVADDGSITLKTRVEVSSFVEFTPAGYPRVATREAETTVRVKDGEIMVIGGLLSDEEIKSFQKVPLLGDIPLFKKLFRYKSTDHTQRDLVIFLTPKILKDGESPMLNRLNSTPGALGLKSSEE